LDAENFVPVLSAASRVEKSKRRGTETGIVNFRQNSVKQLRIYDRGDYGSSKFRRCS